MWSDLNVNCSLENDCAVLKHRGGLTKTLCLWDAFMQDLHCTSISGEGKRGPKLKEIYLFCLSIGLLTLLFELIYFLDLLLL